MAVDEERAAIERQLDYIAAHMLTREEITAEMSAAVAAGIRAAVSDPEMWTAAGDAMRKRAASATGSLVLEGLRSGLRKALLIATIAGSIYAVGGWAALSAAWKAVLGHGAAP